jgi:hypothetical protein
MWDSCNANMDLGPLQFTDVYGKGGRIVNTSKRSPQSSPNQTLFHPTSPIIAA